MSSSLNGQSRLLLAVNGLFVLAGALSGTFLNVYLWKVKQDFAMIGWFTFSQQLALGLTFWIAGKWVKEQDKMISLRLGIVVSGIFYLLVLWAGAHTVDYIWPLGFLFGIGSGLFWLAFNVVYFEVTDVDTRDLFNGWIGILGSVIGILGPWTSGWIISAMKGNLGYRVIFTVSLIVYGIGILLSFWLKKENAAVPTGGWSLSGSLARIVPGGRPSRHPRLMECGRASFRFWSHYSYLSALRQRGKSASFRWLLHLFPWSASGRSENGSTFASGMPECSLERY